ncbi:ribonuclease E/G [Pseudomonas aeruginosa]|uniref:ribonuclease E/G n=1 Tax=Pseudomonas aeruginosa TaxID=287 RepID=UPI00104E630B|nr:ribonuclease E/G [Pseudomonas aeruginosa]
MSEEILINITPMESRVAVVENGVLQEVHVERTQRRGIVGNIYKGRVVRVLPGMQAAFVDIGLERAAFIHAAEISNREGSAVESISALVHEGQALVVQVTKDPIGTKGARLTTHLSIPSRYLVYMPRTSHVGISLRIEDEVERERLKKVVADCVAAEGIEGQGGFILRTAAEGAGEDEILADIRYLRRLWDQIAAQIQTVGAPSVIYEDPAIARQLRLRNLGGIIIIDFIDMEDEEHRRQVLRTLEKQLERDHAKTNIIGITELGLVQMTRKRTRESLVQILCEPCPCCQGRGMLKTAETTCYEIFREILREARAYQADSYLVLANQKVVDRLLDEESGNVADLEAFIGRTIKFQVEAMYSQEQYDVVLL